MPTLRRSTIETFWSRVSAGPEDACWPWRGALAANGYGRFAPRVDGRPFRVQAHRLAYELTFGPIPDGLVIDHLCRNRACANPTHMEPVSPRTNVLRGVGVASKNSAKTHCVDGHAFGPENTYVTPNGRRMCRECQRRRNRAHYARRLAVSSGG